MSGETAEAQQTEIVLTLYRGLNGTNPSAFRIDVDGVSVFEFRLEGYKFNLPIRAVYKGEKTAGTIAELSKTIYKARLPNTRRNSAKVIGRCVFPI